MPATIEAPPSNTPQGVNIIDSGPPKPPPPPKGEIRVSAMPTTAAPATPPKRGSAMDRLQSDLRKKAGIAETPTPPASKPSESPAPEEQSPPPETQPVSPPDETGSPPETKPQTEKPSETTPPAETTAKDKKANPWKLMEEWKQKATKAEKELLETRKSILPEQDRKTYDERIKSVETRNKELEDEIRYVNYAKSPDYQKNFEAPYEEAFKRSLRDLSEVTVQGQDGNMRPFSAEDLQQFAFSSFVQAKEAANRLYPDFADDIMAARRQIRELWDKKQNALKEWKEKGSVREKEMSEAQKRHMEEISTHIKTTWDKVNQQALEDPVNGEFFKPKEGNEDWNQRLSKGFEMVDRAYSENPADPRLTPEQRASIIKRHAAVRNRAASWGAVKNEAVMWKTKYEEVMKKLEDLQKTTPPIGGSQPSSPSSEPGKAMDRLKADLRKYAHLT